MNSKNIIVLLEEYKEMRSEIRSSISIYFSLLFGALFTGIAASFYKATENCWLYVCIPYFVCSWIGIITFIRCNIQHISSYLIYLETEINNHSEKNLLYYETIHAPKLWFSKIFVVLASITALPVIALDIFSIVKSYYYMTEKVSLSISLSNLVATSTLTVFMICLFVYVPKKTRSVKFTKPSSAPEQQTKRAR